MIHKGVLSALLAAALFGASTPLAKLLGGRLAPVMLAAVLYLGSGLGLLAWLALRAVRARAPLFVLQAADVPWLAGAIAAGGVAGPVLLLSGLAMMPASSASLLLNLEGVLTAVLAWCVFKENVDRRIFAGMLLIVVAGLLLSWDQAGPAAPPWAALAVAGACLCWAIDNNLTRKVSAGDPFQIAALKGLVAGSVNLGIGLALGYPLPTPGLLLAAGTLGLLGYGLSLVLFVVALRHLGTARTGAYFSAAPFVGAGLALLLPGERPGALFWVALALMAAGLWLHLTEHHEHEHEHLPMLHTHAHRHDEHHQHDHAVPCDADAEHSHEHQHVALRHAHPHYPDIHHRHEH